MSHYFSVHHLRTSRNRCSPFYCNPFAVLPRCARITVGSLTESRARRARERGALGVPKRVYAWRCILRQIVLFYHEVSAPPLNKAIRALFDGCATTAPPRGGTSLQKAPRTQIESPEAWAIMGAPLGFGMVCVLGARS